MFWDAKWSPVVSDEGSAEWRPAGEGNSHQAAEETGTCLDDGRKDRPRPARERHPRPVVFRETDVLAGRSIPARRPPECQQTARPC